MSKLLARFGSVDWLRRKGDLEMRVEPPLFVVGIISTINCMGGAKPSIKFGGNRDSESIEREVDSGL